MQDNLKAKYGITAEELKRVAVQIRLGKIECDRTITLIALLDLVENGDIAGEIKPDVIFKSAEHEQFYNEQLAKCTCQDCYHRALFYTLGINEGTRSHINEIYDFDQRCMAMKALNASWITSSSVRVLRLAFNLFTGRVSESTHKERYAVGEIFDHGDEEYLFQAIKLRYRY